MLRIALIFSLFYTPVYAAFLDGNVLFDYCTSENQEEETLCAGYIIGISDIMDGGTEISGRLSCVDQSVTVRQTTDVVKQWLSENPELRHFAASSLVAVALQDAFPCE